jgi:hypothetical protein
MSQATSEMVMHAGSWCAEQRCDLGRQPDSTGKESAANPHQPSPIDAGQDCDGMAFLILNIPVTLTRGPGSTVKPEQQQKSASPAPTAEEGAASSSNETVTGSDTAKKETDKH